MVDSTVNQSGAIESSKQNSTLERFEFTGTGSEYFGIWIVNILLTIITLGIYSAWAKVRNKQYFYGNTYIADSAFEYTASPIQILKGRAIAVVAFIIYQFASGFFPLLGLVLGLGLTILVPWIICKSLAFNARYSQYRNIPFRFNQDVKGAFKAYVLLPLLFVIPLIIFAVAAGLYSQGEPEFSLDSEFLPKWLMIGLPSLAVILFLALYPFIQFLQKTFIVNNHNYGTTEFNYRRLSAKPFYFLYAKVFLAAILLFVMPVVLISILGKGLSEVVGETAPVSGYIHMMDSSFISSILGGVFALLIYVSLYTSFFAYVAARVYNLVYQKANVGPHKLRANMTARGLFWIYFTNTLGIILTMGLYTAWAKVRAARYRADHTAIRTQGELDNFVKGEEEKRSALGEEFGEMFDIDIAI